MTTADRRRSCIVMRGLEPRIYRLPYPDAVLAPKRVGPRV
jgi:hypothetical protein